MDSRRICVVCRLTAVGVVVRSAVFVLAFLMTEYFASTVSNNFVSVHIHRCTCTALYHVGNKVFVELAVDDFAASLCHSVADFVVDFAQLAVCFNSSQLNVSHCDNVVWVVAHSLSRDMVVVHCTLCLHTVVCVSWYLKLAQEVAFNTEFLVVCLVCHIVCKFY